MGGTIHGSGRPGKPDRALFAFGPYDRGMRIEVRDDERQRIGWVEVDPAARPTRVEIPETDKETFLQWDAAVDDAGRLRRCVVCGCQDLYVQRMFPQLTGFVVVLAFAGAAIGILGLAENPLVLAALVIVLVLDIASFAFRRHRLVCYRCRSSYADVEIARHLKPWDRAVAERYASERAAEKPAATPTDTLPSVQRRTADVS